LLFTFGKLGAQGLVEISDHTGSACCSKLCHQGHQRAWGLRWLSSCNDSIRITEFYNMVCTFPVQYIYKLPLLLPCRFQFTNGVGKLPVDVGLG